MIRFSKEEGFIKPQGIKFREYHDRNVVLPKVAVGVFSRHLIESMIEHFQVREVGYLSAANYEKNIYILTYKNVELTLFMASVGGPCISADIEELHAQGVEKFIIFGNCGVLDSAIEDCSIIIPTKAFRDEGCSYHYVEASDTIEMNPKYIGEFLAILKQHGFDHTMGATWTTDAFYRETRDKIDYFKSQGAVCVEMEGSVIAAVCQKKNLDYFTFYYAGDNLDGEKWDERSLHGMSNLNRKQEVVLLALELAVKIQE